MRLSFSNASLRDVPDRVNVTASFGVASLSGSGSLSELLSRADSALYNAKEAGRDRVRLSYQHVAERKPPTALNGAGIAAEASRTAPARAARRAAEPKATAPLANQI